MKSISLLHAHAQRPPEHPRRGRTRRRLGIQSLTNGLFVSTTLRHRSSFKRPRNRCILDGPSGNRDRLLGFSGIKLCNHLQARTPKKAGESLTRKLPHGKNLCVLSQLCTNRLDRLLRRPHDKLVDRIGRGTIFSGGESGGGHSASPDARLVPTKSSVSYNTVYS